MSFRAKPRRQFSSRPNARQTQAADAPTNHRLSKRIAPPARRPTDPDLDRIRQRRHLLGRERGARRSQLHPNSRASPRPMSDPYPVRKGHCKSCPFLPTGLTEFRPILEERVMQGEGTPICHSTGHNPSICEHPDSPIEHACRGARNLALRVFVAAGLLARPTDEEWSRQCTSMGMKPPPPTDL